MHDENQYAAGYTIFGTLEGKYSAIIDRNGYEIWNSGNQDVVYYNFTSGGEFLGCRFLDDNIYENYLNSVEFSLTDGIIWEEPNNEFAHHEILKLPWGNYLGIVSKDTIAPIPEGDWGAMPYFQLQGDEFPWRYDKLVEWDKNTKEVIWSWEVIDHYSMEDYDSTLWNFTTLNVGIFAWTHINAIFYDEEDSSIYISSRHLSRITKIDYPSRNIIWNMGHEMPSGDVNFGHDLGFSWQHSLDIQDNGNIVFLDNGNKSEDYRNTEYRTTRAMEISIDETDAVPVANIVWEYDLPENLFGMASGNVQKLHNGNYLITTMGNNGTSLEVTADNEIVWEANYGTQLIYRASRLATGCTDPEASNYDPDATVDDGSCEYDCDLGDVNCDGELNVLDIVSLVNIIMNDGEYIELGDVNGDGYLNILDVVTLVNWVVYGDIDCAGVSGHLKDSNGNSVKDAAILLTYDLGQGMYRTNMPCTSLTYSVPASSDVYVWIESMCGDTINVIVDEYKDAGAYSVTWCADDLNGNTVVDGNYIAHFIINDSESNQNLFLLQYDFSDLESIGSQNYHAMTDNNGIFTIPFDCLSFGIELLGMDEFGNPTDNIIVPYKTQVWIIHNDYPTFSTDWYDVDSNNGVFLNIDIP